MSVGRWKRLTDGGALVRRSGKLKAIDTALETFHKKPDPANLEALQKALVQWMQDKGSDWRETLRNQKGAVETLYVQVGDSRDSARPEVPAVRIDTPEGTVTWTGKDAEALVEAQRDALVVDLFEGRTLEWRDEFKKKLGAQATDAVLETRTLARNTKKLVQGSPSENQSRASRLTKSIVDEMVPKHLTTQVTKALNAILPDFMREFAASVTPVVGIMAAGGSTVVSLFKVAIGARRVGLAYDHATEAVFLQASPGKAVDALLKILDRELNYDVTNLAVNTSAFGAKMAALAAGDPAVGNAAAGVASAVAKLTNIIRIIVRDCEEREAANTKIRAGEVDLKIFGVCPIVGAYYVALAPHSALLNILASEYGEKGWMDDAEILIKDHINPLKEHAARLIKSHRFVIPQLEKYAGLKEANQAAIRDAISRVGKTEMEGFGSQDLEDGGEEGEEG